MDLTLAEQLLLIQLDGEKGGDTSQWGGDPGLAGALPLDLARAGSLEAGEDGERVADDLVARGVLDEHRRKLPGVFPQTRFPQRDPGPERELRTRLGDVLVTGRDVQTAIMVATMASVTAATAGSAAGN